MKPKPFTPGTPILFRDHNGVAHPGIFVARNPQWVRVLSGEIELIVAAGNVERVAA